MSNQFVQSKLVPALENIPVEIFKWGSFPDHFIIDMPHKHIFYELLFFEKGGGVHEIDFQEYKAQSNSIHFIPSNTIHFLKRDPDLEVLRSLLIPHFWRVTSFTIYPKMFSLSPMYSISAKHHSRV